MLFVTLSHKSKKKAIMKFLIIPFASLSLIIFSCCGTKNTTKETVNETKTSAQSMDSKKMIADNYWEGTIVLSKKEGDCPVMIKIDNKEGSYFLDPINISEKYGSYVSDGKKVWVKYAGLRMMNRCDKASPVNIIDLKSK